MTSKFLRFQLLRHNYSECPNFNSKGKSFVKIVSQQLKLRKITTVKVPFFLLRFFSWMRSSVYSSHNKNNENCFFNPLPCQQYRIIILRKHLVMIKKIFFKLNEKSFSHKFLKDEYKVQEVNFFHSRVSFSFGRWQWKT